MKGKVAQPPEKQPGLQSKFIFCFRSLTRRNIHIVKHTDLPSPSHDAFLYLFTLM